MGIRESLIRFMGGIDTKSFQPLFGRGAQYSIWGMPSHNNQLRSYDKLAQEGYEMNIIVYRCIKEVAQGIASIPLVLHKNDEQFEGDHPIIDLLERPNPLESRVEFFQSLVSYLLLSGNAFAHKIKTGEQVKELHLLRPDRIRIVENGQKIPLSYEYTPKEGGKTQTFNVDPVSGKSDIKHIRLWNPRHDYEGLSPIVAAALSIDNHNEASKHNAALLKNGARPTGALRILPKDESGQLSRLTNDQREQMDSVMNNYTGTGNAGKPMLLEGDFEWISMGQTARDMDFLALKNMSAREIALAFGVPGQLVGIPDSQTYSNVAQARIALYEETIIPLAQHIQSDLNEWLMPDYGEGEYCIKYNTDDVSIIAEKRLVQAEQAMKLVDTGIITPNEARALFGLEKMEGLDQVYMSSNRFPLNGEGVPAPEGDADREGEKAYGKEED